MDRKLINPQICTDIANAIRSKSVGNDRALPIKVSELAEKVKDIPQGYTIDRMPGLPWERPESWPNLDLVPKSNDTLYITVDTSGRISNPFISFRVVASGGNYTVTYGSLNVSTGVVTGNTVNVTSNTDFSIDLSSYVGMTATVVVKVVASGNLTDFYFRPYTNSSKGTSYTDYQNPVVEITGYCTNKASNGVWGTYYLERDSRVISACAATALTSAWYNCYSLRSLDVSQWDTSNWALTNLSNTWYNCYSLPELDLSNWNTSNWAVTNMVATWRNCYAMHTLNISNWDTSKWGVTNFDGPWMYCSSLKELDLSNWNTSGWAVTHLTNTWAYCYSLEKLEISNWDTSLWTVTSLGYTWLYCRSLSILNLENWDTSNWLMNTTNSLIQTWYTCGSLKYLGISSWDTTKWAIKTQGLRYTWGGCYSLTELDLSGWDTSDWTINSLSHTWISCLSLKSLKVSTWDTSNWAVIDIANTWCECNSLMDFEPSSWDTSNWAVTNMTQTWSGCSSLRELDLSNWDASGWDVTAFVIPFQSMYQVREIQFPQNFSISVADISRVFYGDANLEIIDLSCFDLSVAKTWYFSTSYPQWLGNGWYCKTIIIFGTNNNNKIVPDTNIQLQGQIIPTQSVVNLFNALGTTATSRTITLGATCLNRLTSAEKVIATNKGYTLA